LHSDPKPPVAQKKTPPKRGAECRYVFRAFLLLVSQNRETPGSACATSAK